METRVAVISIIVENTDAVEPLNGLLHTYREYIIGRMGIPHREKGINIICVVLDAPLDKINALSGALGFPPRWLIPRSERGIAWKSLEAFTIEYKHPLTLKPILEVKDTMIFLQTYDL